MAKRNTSVVDQAEAVEQNAPDESVQQWRFISNHRPGQTVTFTDGTSLKINGTLFVTEDAELAKKIEEVAEKHQLIQ